MERDQQRLFVRNQALRAAAVPAFMDAGFVASWRPIYQNRSAIKVERLSF